MPDTPDTTTDAATAVTAIADPADATQATASDSAAPAEGGLLDPAAPVTAAPVAGSLDTVIVARGESFLAAIEAIPGEVTAELKAAAAHIRAAITTALAHL